MGQNTVNLVQGLNDHSHVPQMALTGDFGPLMMFATCHEVIAISLLRYLLWYSFN